MRIRIIFLLKNRGGNVPFHHQYLLAQMIKGVVLKGSEEKFANYRFYNFSGIKGQTKVSRKGLHFFSSRVTLVFSCPNKDFINYFLSSLFELEEVEIGNLVLKPETVEREEPIQISDSMKFICISPMVLVKPTVYDSSAKKFINPESDAFSDLLYDSTLARMKETEEYTAKQLADFYKFQLVPDKKYLARLTEQQKKYARIYPVYDLDTKFEVRGYTFPFTLYAAKEVQEFVFYYGFGFYTHKGFGMLDIANTDPNSRVLKYDFNYA